jgi:hypothetical protein
MKNIQDIQISEILREKPEKYQVLETSTPLQRIYGIPDISFPNYIESQLYKEIDSVCNNET